MARGTDQATVHGGEQAVVDSEVREVIVVGSGLAGVLYVLDEPSIGLHQRDNARPRRTARR